MCRFHPVLLLLAVLIGGPRSICGQDTDPRGEGFNTFRLVTQRNIFNPDRRRPPPVSERRTPPPRQPDPDIVRLTGTMLYQDRQIAFFDGSDRDFRGAKEVEQNIADLVVEQITTDRVFLRRVGSDEKIVMMVGTQLRRVGDDPWETQTGGRGSFPSSSASRSRSVSSTRGPATDSGAGADSDGGGESAAASDASASEILKRLMEKRRQEMQQ